MFLVFLLLLFFHKEHLNVLTERKGNEGKRKGKRKKEKGPKQICKGEQSQEVWVLRGAQTKLRGPQRGQWLCHVQMAGP